MREPATNRLLGIWLKAGVLAFLLALAAVVSGPLASASADPPARPAGAALASEPQLSALERAPDGDIVAVGTTGTCGNGYTNASCAPDELLAVHLGPDGSPEPSFGEGGAATAPVAGTSEVQVDSAAVEADGSIVLTGSATPGAGSTPQREMLLARFTAGGALDPNFGSGGIVTFVPPGALLAEGEAVVVQPDGGIIVAGRTVTPGQNDTFLLAGFLPDGALDPGFAQSGWTSAFASTSGSGAGTIALEPDGRIVVAGDVAAPEEASLALARYLPDGRLDPSFGEGGLLRTATVSGEFAGAGARSLGVLPGGDILLAGTSGAGPHPCPEPTLVRLGPDGAAEAGFGPWRNGVSRPAWVGSRRACVAAPTETTLPSGASLVAGNEASGSGLPLLIARFGAGGALDPRFGTAGGEELPAPGGAAFTGPASLLGVGRGRLIVGTTVHAARCYGPGVADGTPCRAIALSRLRPDGEPDRSFGDGGAVLIPAARLCRPAAPHARPCRALLTAEALKRTARARLPRSAALTHHALVVRLHCPAAVATLCRATAVARLHRRAISKRSRPIKIGRGRSRIVPLALVASARRPLAPGRTLTLREEVAADHVETVISGTIRLR